MARRYIDADALIEKLKEQKDCRGALFIPFLTLVEIQATADVVPKSEVDKDIKALTKEVAKQKAMLLDAIDTFRNLLCIESFVDYEDTRKHYAVNINDVNRIHDELKKKYTEDKQRKEDEGNDKKDKTYA